MKLGDRVRCTAYAKRSKNCYELSKGGYGGYDGCLYWEYGSSEGVVVEDFHSCDRFKVVMRQFSGIFVGTTVLSTRINVEYEEPLYGPAGFRTYCDKPVEFAVVYYADNKKRLVPMYGIEAVE